MNSLSQTCGIVLYKDVENHPVPPAISFGWRSSQVRCVEDVRSMFQWQGMLDSYIPYITLSKVR